MVGAEDEGEGVGEVEEVLREARLDRWVMGCRDARTPPGQPGQKQRRKSERKEWMNPNRQALHEGSLYRSTRMVEASV